MIQLPEYLVWIGAVLAAGYVAALSWRLRVSRQFPLLTAYLVLSLAANVCRFVVLETFGLSGEQYMVTYYISDAIVSVAVYLVVIELFRRVLPAKHRKFLPQYSLAILILLILFSYAVIGQEHFQMVTSFAYELSQNLWFVSVGLTLFLWSLIYFRGLPRGMAAQMVRVWGVYFLLIASAYLLYNFFPHLPPSAPRLHLDIPEMAGMWLPLGLGFAILNKSESDPS